MTSLLRLECQQKDFFKTKFDLHFTVFFLFKRMELKRQLRSYPPIATLDTINYSRPKWAKSPPLFRPKWCKNHTLWDGTYLYGLYKGVPPPLPPVLFFFHICLLTHRRETNHKARLFKELQG